MPNPEVSKPRSDLVQSVLDALESCTTIVTPNKRTAAWLRKEFDDAQIAAGRAVWQSAQVLPWTSWLATLWQRMRSSARGTRMQLLTSWQEERIWSDVIGEATRAQILHTPNAVRLALGAWQIVHGWNGPWAQWGGETNRDEERAFVGWATAFARRCSDNGWIDSARIPLVIIDALRSGTLDAEESIALYGFAELTPQQRELLEALRAAGTSVVELREHQDAVRSTNAEARRIGCKDPIDEWRKCARWCRESLLQSKSLKIAVVVPDLARQKQQIERIFNEILCPERLLGHSTGAPFNISQGQPLAHQQLVSVALTLLRWPHSTIDASTLGALTRSPYIKEFDDEWAQRAQIAREAIDESRATWRLETFASFAARRSPLWSAQLLALDTAASDWSKRRSAKAWRLAWEKALEVAGWPGERALDSVEFQTRGAWNEMLDDWMRAETISGPMTATSALESLADLAARTIFQPESGDVPIQILGTLEAAGLHFDRMWVCGLTADRWPASPLPTPLLPLAWQRMVDPPHASSERELRYHRELTLQLSRAADEVIFSWPLKIDDIPAIRSPLLDAFAEVEPGELAIGSSLDLYDVIHAAGTLDEFDDERGLPLAAGSSGGRVALIEAQANCPFQAYARFRLGVEPWPDRVDGLDPRERGTLVHCVLAEFWGTLKGRSALLDLDMLERVERTDLAVDTAMRKIPGWRWEQLGQAIREIERDRLLALLEEWLRLEVERPPFTVIATEAKQEMNIGGLGMRLRIDRIDAVAGGAWMLTDYKTGKSAIRDVQRDDRLVAPQLPLYAEAVAPEEVAVLAYATVRRGECAIAGIAESESIAPGLKEVHPDWASARIEWRRQLEELVGEYLSGYAAVTPWRYPMTCGRCHLHALCRINSRLDFVATEEGGEAQ